MVFKVVKVTQENQVSMVFQVEMVCQEVEAYPDLLDLLVDQVKMVIKETLARLVRKGLKVTLVCKVHLDPLVNKGLRVPWAQLDHLEKLVPKDHKVFQVPREMKVQEAHQVFQDFLDCKAYLALKVEKETLEIQDKEDHLDPLGLRAHQEHQEHRERLELQDHQVLKVLEVVRVTLVFPA